MKYSEPPLGEGPLGASIWRDTRWAGVGKDQYQEHVYLYLSCTASGLSQALVQDLWLISGSGAGLYVHPSGSVGAELDFPIG